MARYDLREELGSGGMGAVFRARDCALDREVAVKVLKPGITVSGSATERFRREVAALTALSHPHVVKIFDAGEVDGRLYYVMELLDGADLQETVKRRGPLAVRHALDIANQLLDALDYIHHRGMFHRDIKSSNIMLVEDGTRAVLTDFGLVQLTDRTLITAEGIRPGTPRYMAPEVLQGQQVTAATDLWSLGIVLFEMLTGAAPFRSDLLPQLLVSIMKSPIPWESVHRPIPDDVRRFVSRFLEKQPEQRWPSAWAAREALGLAMRSSPEGEAEGGLGGGMSGAKGPPSRTIPPGSAAERATRATSVQAPAAASPGPRGLVVAVSVIALAVAALVSYLRAPAPLAAVPVSVHLGSSRARVVWSGPPDGPALARYRPDRPDATWVEVEERTPPARGRHDLTLERLDAGTVYRLELLRSAGAGPVASVRVPVPAAGTRVMRLLEEVARGVPGPVGDPDRIVVGLLDPDDLARLRQILGEARDTLLEGRELAELSRTRGLAAASLLSCAAPEHASFVAATTARILDAPPRASDSVWLAAVGHNLAPDLGLLRGALLEATRGRGRFRTMTEARAGLLVARAHWLAGRVEEAIAAARQVNQRFPGMMEPYALLLEMGVAGLAIPEVVTCEADGAPMAYVPPGHFWMGSSLEDPDAERDEMPIHVVRLSGFFIDRFLVSKGRFAPFNAWVARLNDHSRCHESSSCRKARRWSTHTLMDEDEFIAGVAQTVPARKGELAQVLPQGSDDHPVTSVSWFDAFSYAAWAGKELPTEAQWEKAARGDDKRLYPWGNEPPTVQLANFRELIGHLTPVDQFARVPSPYGAKDMVGNAWQWCADWYHEAWYREQLDRPADPTGPPTGWRRSQRGGAWYNSRVVLRVANRDSASPSSARLQRWGFRTVRTIRRLDRGR